MNSSSLSLFALAALGSLSFAAEIDFNREIRPILSNHCYACHGPDANKRKADLRLDQKDSAFGPAESGECAVIPGNLEKSELIRRITSTDKDEAMPPPKELKQLKTEQIELLKRWVAQGAKWTAHWAFEPIQTPPIPNGQTASRGN